MRKKVKKYFLLLCIIIFIIPISVFSKEIQEEDIDAKGSSLYISEGDEIYRTSDLSVPNERIMSIDVNHDGEILLCFRSKAVVFNNDFYPIRAYDIKWKKGSIPFTVWNKQTNQIVYIRGFEGYEMDVDGNILLSYKNIAPEDYRFEKVEWEGIEYRLEDHTLFPNTYMTYSTLIRRDIDGKETILHNAIISQLYTETRYFLFVFILIVYLAVRQCLGKKRE